MVSLAIEIRYYRHLRVCRGKKRSGHRSHQSTATHLSPSTDKAFSCLFFAPLVILGSICTAFSVWASFGLLLLPFACFLPGGAALTYLVVHVWPIQFPAFYSYFELYSIGTKKLHFWPSNLHHRSRSSAPLLLCSMNHRAGSRAEPK